MKSSKLRSKVIPCYPDYDIYEDGQIYSRLRNRFLNPSDRDGYLFVRLMQLFENGERKRGSGLGVHRVVAMAFLKNSSNLPIVNHLDGNPYNNHVSNLEWASHSRSSQHARDEGLVKSYTRPVLQYTLENKFIKRLDSITEAAKEMNCHLETIGKCCRKKHTAKGYKWRYETERERFSTLPGEKWKVIPNHEKYKASTEGRLYSLKMKIILGRKQKKDGYTRVKLGQTTKYLHTWIALTFLGKPPKTLENPVVDHIDNDPTNNRLSNLHWIEFNDNIQKGHATVVVTTVA